MTLSNALKEKIESGKARLADLDRERLILTTQIETYEDTLSLISQAEMSSDESASSRSSRRTSANWAATLFPFIKGKGRVFSIDDILTEAGIQGFQPTRGNVRSQMGAYKTKNWIKSVGEGQFKVTDEGRKQLLSSDQYDDRLQWDEGTGTWINAVGYRVTNEDDDDVVV